MKKTNSPSPRKDRRVKRVCIKGFASNTFEDGWLEDDTAVYVYKDIPQEKSHWVPVTITYTLPRQPRRGKKVDLHDKKGCPSAYQA